jgi:hypothetical protein
VSAIKLGQTVRDTVSGFSGIAIHRLDQLNGNVQYAIQPKQKEGETSYPEAMFIDHHMLEVLNDGVSAKVTKAANVPEVLECLGTEVVDKITNFHGITTQKATYMNGCVSFEVVSKDKKKTDAKTGWFDFARLQTLDGTWCHLAAEPNDKMPGGPAQRVQRQAVR